MFDHSLIFLEEGGVRRGRMVMWNSCFLRYFQDWEMDNVEEFLESSTLGRSRGEEGRMVWKASKVGILDEVFLLSLGVRRIALFILFIWHFVGSPIFCEGLVNGLEWELCEQEEKKGLENNSSLPFMDNLEGQLSSLPYETRSVGRSFLHPSILSILPNKEREEWVGIFEMTRKAWRFGGSNPGAGCKLSGECESLATDVLRISVTEGSGHVAGEVEASSSPIRRRRISGWNEGEFPSGGMSDATYRKGPSACPREREPRGTLWEDPTVGDCASSSERFWAVA
ncbi:hypothetical protein AAG906_022024 [Vitis piasezkii]